MKKTLTSRNADQEEGKSDNPRKMIHIVYTYVYTMQITMHFTAAR